MIVSDWRLCPLLWRHLICFPVAHFFCVLALDRHSAVAFRRIQIVVRYLGRLLTICNCVREHLHDRLNCRFSTCIIYRVGQKMTPFIVRLITSPNINRFSKFFHYQNQETICNEFVITDPTTPQVCRYTTSWNVRWRTQSGDATDRLRDQRWSSLACGPLTTQT